MATISSTKVSLRIMGDDLLPEDITDILGCEPTFSHSKGEKILGKNTGKERIAKFGMWRLEAPEEIPGDLDSQIEYILESLSADLNRWIELYDNFEIDLFCGLFIREEMEGISISSKNMQALGERGIELELDIYGPESTNS